MTRGYKRRSRRSRRGKGARKRFWLAVDPASKDGDHTAIVVRNAHGEITQLSSHTDLSELTRAIDLARASIAEHCAIPERLLRNRG